MQSESAEKSASANLIAKLAKELEPSFDVLKVPLAIDKKQAFLFYIRTVVDGVSLQDVVIKPFYEMASQKHFEAYINSLPSKVEIKSDEDLLIDLTRGSVLISIEDRFVLLDLPKVNNDVVQENLNEITIHGPKLALSENLETNVNLIRNRYSRSTLKFESLNLTDQSKKSIVILYDEKSVCQNVLRLVKEKLHTLDTPLVQSSGDLKLFLNDKKWSLFPTTLLTERPDRIVYNLASGKVILMVEGSPQVLVAPVIFFDFMSSMDDTYQNKWTSLFITSLRYLGLFICIVLPSLYVAIASYNPEIFRIELALTVAGSRIGVPYSSFLEVLFMLTFIELLTEASIRLPKSVSATATTVGGLILGTAATEAALASSIMIIIVSAVAISTFVIPFNEMSFAMRIARFLLLGFTTFFGVSGLIFGFLALIMYMTDIESFGNPYLKLNWKNKKKEVKVNNT